MLTRNADGDLVTLFSKCFSFFPHDSKCVCDKNQWVTQLTQSEEHLPCGTFGSKNKTLTLCVTMVISISVRDNLPLHGGYVYCVLSVYTLY